MMAVAAVTLTTGARAPGGTTWRPLAVGSRSVYDVTLEEETDGRSRPHRMRTVASLAETVVARGKARGGERAWYEVESERRDAAVGGERVRTTSTWLSAEGGALREVARARSADTPERHSEALLWVPAAVAPGSRWRVGTLALAEGALALEGSAAAGGAIETPAGRFEDCLELRYTGAYEAGAAGAAGARLASGTFVSSEWLARGVGTVRAVVAQDGAGMRRALRLREVRTLRSRGPGERHATRERESRGGTP
jgi:hypothetical protein